MVVVVVAAENILHTILRNAAELVVRRRIRNLVGSVNAHTTAMGTNLNW